MFTLQSGGITGMSANYITTTVLCTLWFGQLSGWNVVRGRDQDGPPK